MSYTLRVSASRWPRARAAAAGFSVGPRRVGACGRGAGFRLHRGRHLARGSRLGNRRLAQRVRAAHAAEGGAPERAARAGEGGDRGQGQDGGRRGRVVARVHERV